MDKASIAPGAKVEQKKLKWIVQKRKSNSTDEWFPHNVQVFSSATKPSDHPEQQQTTAGSDLSTVKRPRPTYPTFVFDFVPFVSPATICYQLCHIPVTTYLKQSYERLPP